MKNFSEAIRDGSKQHKQCTDGWSSKKDGQFTTCAMMAAAVDLGIFVDKGGDDFALGDGVETRISWDERTGARTRQARVPDQFHALLWSLHQRPCACGEQEFVFHTIQHLNDKHKWSREAIAEWVEVIEKKIGIFREEKKEETKTEVVSAPVVTGDCVECGKKD